MTHDNVPEVSFDSFAGRTFTLEAFSADMFRLDGHVYKALEDEDDGYRSSLWKVVEVQESELRPNIAPVQVECRIPEAHSFCGMRFMHGDKVVLEVGTGDCDDYYPYFVCRYTPIGAP